MRKSSFEIENHAKNEGCFISILKYSTLSIIGFIILWWLLLRYGNALGFQHAGFFSFLIAITIIGYFLNKVIFKSDEIYKIIFDDENKQLTLISGNSFDGIDVKKTLNYSSIRVVLNKEPIFKSNFRLIDKNPISSDKLSQNRQIKLYENHKLVNTIDIDLTPWCRHENIEEIINKLKVLSNTKN